HTLSLSLSLSLPSLPLCFSASFCGFAVCLSIPPHSCTHTHTHTHTLALRALSEDFPPYYICLQFTSGHKISAHTHTHTHTHTHKHTHSKGTYAHTCSYTHAHTPTLMPAYTQMYTFPDTHT